MQRPYYIFLTLTFTLITSVSVAQPQFGPVPHRPDGPPRGQGPDHVSPIIKAIDENADGILSKDEIAKASDALNSLDENKDGQLTPDELRPQHDSLRSAHHPPHEEMFARLMKCDKNKDQRISKDEVSQELTALFGSADLDRDGILTNEEIRKSRDQHQRNWQHAKSHKPDSISTNAMVNFIMSERDANADGKLTGDEIPERLKGTMAVIDVNKDGEIDIAELEQLAKSLKTRMSHHGPHRWKGPSKERSKDAPSDRK